MLHGIARLQSEGTVTEVGRATCDPTSVVRLSSEGGGGGGGGFGGGGDESIPPDYRSGFGQEGVDALEEFVESGGTLVTFAQAGSFAIEKFGLPIRNVVSGLSSTEFWSLEPWQL